MKTEKRITVLGPPGAGKGTQCQKIADYLDVPHISTGEMLRKHKDLETEHGKASDYMDRGEYVPDRLIFRILDRRLEKPDAEEGFVLDGFPRDMDQVEHLEKRGGVELVLMIDIDEEEAVRRLSGRRSCQNCGTSFHTEFDPPEEEGVCDRCGGELVQRDDDRPEVIRERFEEYQEKTVPVIEHYREEETAIAVNGSKRIEEVWNDIKRILEMKFPGQK